VKRDLMLSGDRLGGVGDGLHLFRAVVETEKVIGAAASTAAPTLPEDTYAHGGDDDESRAVMDESFVISHE
jgi:hypothetical protein